MHGGLDVWGNDKSGSDVAVGCLAEALLWSFSDFYPAPRMRERG